MKQVAQRPRDGSVCVRDVPAPAVRPGTVAVATRYSLLSAGTERTKIEVGSKNLIQKARVRPDLAKKVIDRARVEGLRSAVSAVQDRLEALAPIGYSSAGVVRAVGAGVSGIAPGDRVACGGRWANHAEALVVPRNLVATVPAEVELEDAAYATVGAVALHAVRQASASLGERIGVIGLGLVGQLSVRILAAAGCEAFGVDVDAAAVDVAHRAGAQTYARHDPSLLPAVLDRTGGLGLDAVLVCAAGSSPDPLALAAALCRSRGRIVVVGDVPIAADRAVLYEKELELRLSRSYGAGRYDRDYEEHGRDLPAAYVRWTEQRNMQAFVDLVASGRLRPSELTTHRFPVDCADQAYAVLAGKVDGPRAFGILLEYEPPPADVRAIERVRAPRTGGTRLGLIGGGSFARLVLLPALRRERVTISAVATESGLSAADVASRFGIERAAATPEEILEDDSIDAVVIATRHASHARLAAASLRAGKAVLVEKPLALSDAELDEVEAALVEDSIVMVGLNRRFAPLTLRLRDELEGVPHPVLLARVNAGPLPGDHWLHDPEDGGGRLIGEGCHFVDLLQHLAGSPAISVHAVATPPPDRPLECSDSVTATLRLADGTVAALVYAGDGDPRLPKERIEAFGGGLSAVLDDFRQLEIYRRGKRAVVRRRQDKGHAAQVAHFLAAASGMAPPPPAQSYLSSARATVALADSLRTGVPVEVA
jgi:predicted dehydrogenase/threonine dehydrogenase-like Zn-dependent dehydrogenase